ncbi:hypothetical protein HK100_011815 [Physocladia obscura]|uniref:Uncharacterized protein n=1 Tax=Physocladia obscura TaxID=109957 RepID=A0AAD5T376_9FUNG|nr:hypothetical protein HK100_011815 [Physocladia obscura]
MATNFDNINAEDEIQVIPGVYMTTFSTPAPPVSERDQINQSTSRHTAAGIPVATLDEITESDNPELLQLEIARLRLSTQKLLESNALLKEFDAADPDPEYSLAISENVVIIDKQLRRIKRLMQNLAAILPGGFSRNNGSEDGILPSSGPCHSEMFSGLQQDTSSFDFASNSLISTIISNTLPNISLPDVTANSNDNSDANATRDRDRVDPSSDEISENGIYI